VSTAADDTLLDRHNGFKVLRRGPKRSEASAIPDVHTYHATEASVTLEGIDKVDDFVEKLDRIEPPGQMISFLTDPLLQKYVELKPSPVTSTRIDLWLSASLEDLYEVVRLRSGDPKYAKEILDGLLRHAESSKELHPTTINFLRAYIPLWNGQDNVDPILGLLAHVPVDPFEDAYTDYFSPIERALAPQGPSAYEKVIDFYTSLLKHQIWVATSQPARRNSAHSEVFKDLAAHVFTISNSLLLSLPAGEGEALISSILSFYELLSTSTIPHIVPIILPPMHLVYLLAQHASPTTFSRICGIIAACKEAFDAHPKPVKQYYPNHVTDAMNWCLRDIYHLIWISRALITADQKALGFHCDAALRSLLNDYLGGIDREYAIGQAFLLSNNAWLASLSAAAWRDMEEGEISREGYDKSNIRYHQGPVSQRSLEVLKRKGGVSVDWDGKGGYKFYVLNWLADRGLSGVRELMVATVSELRK
jgi:centromere protein I